VLGLGNLIGEKERSASKAGFIEDKLYCKKPFLN
jgi:hypothetical protein